jgi:hypothetical protein
LQRSVTGSQLAALAEHETVRSGAAKGDGAKAEFWLEATGVLGALLAPLLRRRIFSRNTKSATEGLKQFMEAPR